MEPNITQVKQNLETHGFVLIPGKDMKKLLIQRGASEDDLAVLESGYIHKHLPIDQQPAMYHRLVCVVFLRIAIEPIFSELLSPHAPKHDRQHDLHCGHSCHHPVPQQ